MSYSTSTDKAVKARDRRDVQNLIAAVLDSPIKAGAVEEVDGVRSLESLRKKNTTVMTRIVMQMAVDAMKGDDRKAKLLFDYAGYAPTKEQQVSVDLPQFIDDISMSVDEADVAVKFSEDKEETE